MAFVGYGALDQLPEKIRNLNVICWPKPGGTHPDGVRRLLDAGINVFFCERLHSKIYWAEGRGVIIGSANLSANALEGKGQHEFAVRIDDKDFDIETVLSQLNYKKVDEEALNRLDIGHVTAANREPDTDEGKHEAPSFLDAMNSTTPKKFKLVWWSVDRDKDSVQIMENKINEETGQRSFVSDNDIDKDTLNPGDFAIQVRTDENAYIARSNATWLRVDSIIKIGRQQVAVQIKKSGAVPPFKIDSKFTKALKSVFNDSDWDEIVDEKYTVTPEFIEKIKSCYESD